jgi:hypothetical protein
LPRLGHAGSVFARSQQRGLLAGQRGLGQGFAHAHVLPASARYDETLREFVLPYEAVRGSKSADLDVLAFLQSSYDAAATLAKWDRSLTPRETRAPVHARPASAHR